MPAGEAGWHTFAAHWRPGRIDFYYDVQLVGSQLDGVVSTQHYLIANLAVSGTAIDVPQRLLIDYVRVWALA